MWHSTRHSLLYASHGTFWPTCWNAGIFTNCWKSSATNTRVSYFLFQIPLFLCVFLCFFSVTVYYFFCLISFPLFILSVSRDISVGIAIRYGLDGPGVESRSGEIFRTRPHRLCGPSSLLCNACRVSFSELKRSGRGVNHPHPSSAEVKETVELYFYSPSGPSCPVLGRNMSFLRLSFYLFCLPFLFPQLLFFPFASNVFVLFVSYFLH